MSEICIMVKSYQKSYQIVNFILVFKCSVCIHIKFDALKTKLFFKNVKKYMAELFVLGLKIKTLTAFILIYYGDDPITLKWSTKLLSMYT